MDQNRYSAKVKQDRSKIDRVRVRHQLRVIIADVLFEIGMKVVRLSKRIRRQNEVDAILQRVRSQKGNE